MLAALAGALYLLQRLRVRHREVDVATTLFWHEAVHETRARVLVQRFRHPWAYALLLAISALLWSVVGAPEREVTAPLRIDTTSGPVDGIELRLVEAAALTVEPPAGATSEYRVGLRTALDDLPTTGGRFRGDAALLLHAPPGTYRLVLLDGSGEAVDERTVDLPTDGATIRF